jgi:hypothetical protein
MHGRRWNTLQNVGWQGCRLKTLQTAAAGVTSTNVAPAASPASIASPWMRVLIT